MPDEIKKQLIDQPLHFLWAFTSAFAPFLAERFAPLVLAPAVTVLGVGSLVFIILREYDQWPSKRWWDPRLDWTFFALGVGSGIAAGRALLS